MDESVAYQSSEDAEALDRLRSDLPLRQAMVRLDKAIAEHEMMVQNMLERIEPLVGPERMERDTSLAVASPGSSPHVMEILRCADRLEGQTTRLRDARDRLEI